MNEAEADPNSPRLRRDLWSMLADGASFSVMVGIGETYVPAFALALGLGEVAAGLIATVPMLAGGLLQLISPWAVRQLGSHRTWVVTCAVCQAASLLLMVVMAVAADVPPWLVFLPTTLYWAAGLATSPAWNAWVDRLVPAPMRATFFARRTRLSHLSVLVGLVSGGVILRTGAGDGRAVSIFAVLFGTAAASRFFSAAMLARQSEPRDEHYLDQSGTSYGELLREMRGGSGMRLVGYLLGVQVAVYVAAPYFTPYMLVQLELPYLEYMVLLSCAFVGKILALHWAGHFARRAGAGRLLVIGSIGIVPLSALWLVSNSTPFLIGLQIVGGMAWAAYELAMLLMFFETIPREHRVAMLSLYNAGNAAAMVAGAVLGAVIMQVLADGKTAYFAVFVISSVGRTLALAWIPRHPPRPPKLERPAGLSTIAVRPMAGDIESPVLPSVTAGAADKAA